VTTVLVDTGPLVAALNAADDFHDWAQEELGRIPAPLLTCEAVISEALHLVRRMEGGRAAVMGLLNDRLVIVPFRLTDELASVSRLLARYANVPMSLADACLVRMSEQHAGAVVMTLDSDFKLYRRHGRSVIPTIAP
jgi:uncharacterized protein